MNYLNVNKSGKNVPIYSISDLVNAVRIGTLYNRESFIAPTGSEVDNAIKFLNSSGELVYGRLIDPPSGTFTEWSEYPYGTTRLPNDSTVYKTFKMRKSGNVYDANGTYWGKVAENCLVACKSALAGDTKPYLKHVTAVQSSSGDWVRVDTPNLSDDKTYGFVDTGLRSGSSYSSIGMFGSW